MIFSNDIYYLDSEAQSYWNININFRMKNDSLYCLIIHPADSFHYYYYYYYYYRYTMKPLDTHFSLKLLLNASQSCYEVDAVSQIVSLVI